MKLTYVVRAHGYAYSCACEGSCARSCVRACPCPRVSACVRVCP